METITLTTNDHVKIVGDFTKPTGSKKTVLLLHMMPATRESWQPLTKALNEHDIATLAIDLRGHGESTAQFEYQLNYKNFSDVEHQASRLDVDASVNFLKSQGFEEKNIFFFGASIGANLSLDALSRYKDAPFAVLLSPGLDYRGVTTDTAIKNIGSHQQAWIYAAKDDEYSAQSSRKLGESCKRAHTKIFDGQAHGTDLFSTEKSLISEIVSLVESA